MLGKLTTGSGTTLLLALSFSRRCLSYKPSVSVDRQKNFVTISPPQGMFSNTELKGSVIFLHGLGDTAFGWGEACNYIAHSVPGVRFLLPTAPSQPVTMNGGYVMPSWYDIVGLDERSNEACEGIEESRDMVLNLIKEENARGIPNEKIILGGFSQGGAVALWTGLQISDKKLGGILCLSGYLPGISKWKLGECSKDVPVRMFHGDADLVVQPWMPQKSIEFLKRSGVTDIKLKTYRGLDHGASEDELLDVTLFLKETFA